MCVAFVSVIHLVVVSAHMFHFDVCLSYISNLAFDFIVAVWSKLPPCSNRIMDEYYVQIEKYMYNLSYIITDYFRKLILLCTSFSDVVFFPFLQDWLDTQVLEFEALRESLTLGEDWLNQMGQAARENDITIQYCGGLSRHLLQAQNIPAVTQVLSLSNSI